MFLLPIVLIGIFLCYVVISRSLLKTARIRFIRTHNIEQIRSRYPNSFLGLALFLEAKRAVAEHKGLENNTERFAKYGSTYGAAMLGKNLVVTKDPENVKAVLSTRFADFGIGERLAAFGPLTGNGIFTSDGHFWEHSRAMIRPNFARSQVAELDKLEDHVRSLISLIPRDGSTVDLQPLFYNLTFDSATEFLVGKSVGCQLGGPNSVAEMVAKAFDYAETQIAVRLRLGKFAVLHFDRKFQRACRILHSAFDDLIDRAHAELQDEDKEDESTARYVFIKELLKVNQDREQVRAQALNVLIAGRDTTAGLLSNLFHALARNPRVWTKLQAEVSKLGGRKPDYATLRGELPYLKAVLNEGLRLYPSVPANTRFANRDTVLPRGGGVLGTSPILVPKGAIVMYSTWAMHRDKDIYGADAEEFNPERWTESTSKRSLRPGWAFLPFNGGPRVCIGQQYALTEAGYTMIRLLQTFDMIENRDHGPWQEHLGVTLSSRYGAKVALGYRSTC